MTNTMINAGCIALTLGTITTAFAAEVTYAKEDGMCYRTEGQVVTVVNPAECRKNKLRPVEKFSGTPTYLKEDGMCYRTEGRIVTVVKSSECDRNSAVKK